MSDDASTIPYDSDQIQSSETTHDAQDGTALSISIFRPESATPDDPVPVLLQRTPYGKPTQPPEGGFAAQALNQGYVVAFEDTRGRGLSDGVFQPWIHEAVDGATTIEWLADQPWATEVGMFGGSSPGQVQLLAAAEDPDGLGAIAPTFTPSDVHRSDFFQDGAMSAMTFITWSFGDSVAGHTVDRLERRGDINSDTADALHDALDDALERIPDLVTYRPLVNLPTSVLGDVDLPKRLSPTDVVPHWKGWTSRPTYNDFWQSFDPEPIYDQITIPGLHTTGWYELCQHGTVTNYTGLRRASPEPQHLVIGPWAHQNQGQEVGEVDFGPRASAAAYGRSKQLLAFFETYLRDEPTVPFTDPNDPLVETFRASVVPILDARNEDDGNSERGAKEAKDREGSNRTGSGMWVAHADWPPTDVHSERWYLSSGGNAASDLTDGTLSRNLPSKFEPADSWIHNPVNPVPTRGGPLCCRDETQEPGAFERSDLQTRDDVATYTTPVFDSPVELAGPVSLRLTATTTAPDTDFTAILTHVTDDGQAYNLCEGIRRVQYRYGRDRSVPVEPDEFFTVNIDLWNIHYEVPTGDRLRLEVASSNHPRFDPHPGTTDPWRATAEEIQPAEQSIFHELDRKSTLTVFRR